MDNPATKEQYEQERDSAIDYLRKKAADLRMEIELAEYAAMLYKATLIQTYVSAELASLALMKEKIEESVREGRCS